MNEHDLTIPGGCIGGPHIRGTEDGCPECVPFQPATTRVSYTATVGPSITWPLARVSSGE